MEPSIFQSFVCFNYISNKKLALYKLKVTFPIRQSIVHITFIAYINCFVIRLIECYCNYNYCKKKNSHVWFVSFFRTIRSYVLLKFQRDASNRATNFKLSQSKNSLRRTLTENKRQTKICSYQRGTHGSRV